MVLVTSSPQLMLGFVLLKNTYLVNKEMVKGRLDRKVENCGEKAMKSG